MFDEAVNTSGSCAIYCMHENTSVFIQPYYSYYFSIQLRLNLHIPQKISELAFTGIPPTPFQNFHFNFIR